jgi:hypothetical protein
MGGIMASRGDWNSLYPIPVLGSLDNAGLSIHSYAKIRWRLLCLAYGVPDYTHFILPPPAALLFIPFSLFSYSQAFWIWTFILMGCTWGTAWVSGQLLRQLVRHPTRLEGILALLIVLSPMTARAIRIANVSPPIAFLIGVALLALLRPEQSLRSAWTILLGATLKYATLVLTPIFVAMRRWQVLIWLAVSGALILLVTLFLAGFDPFIEFCRTIMPTLSRPSWFYGNQSLPGMLARIYGRPFNPMISLGLNVLRLFTLEIVLYRILTIRPANWRDPINLMSATALLIGWLLVFSPIAWEHWPIFLCPIWGWMLWEAREPGLKRVVALSSLVLMYLPAGILQVSGIATYPIVLPEPFNSSQLMGLALLMGLACWRLTEQYRLQTSSEPVSSQELAQMGNFN